MFHSRTVFTAALLGVLTGTILFIVFGDLALRGAAPFHQKNATLGIFLLTFFFFGSILGGLVGVLIGNVIDVTQYWYEIWYRERMYQQYIVDPNIFDETTGPSFNFDNTV